jgi:hypothetical protein
LVDLETVLDTLVETVTRLCRADQVGMFRWRDGKYHIVAARGLSEEAKEFFCVHPLALDRGTISGRVALERRAVHIPDVLQDPEYTYHEGLKVTGARTMLGIPLLREETLIGISLAPTGQFTPARTAGRRGYRRNPHKSPALQAWYDFEQAPLDKAESSTAEACLPSR